MKARATHQVMLERCWSRWVLEGVGKEGEDEHQLPPSTAALAGVVVHAMKFHLKSFSQEKRPFSILDELPPEHSV